MTSPPSPQPDPVGPPQAVPLHQYPKNAATQHLCAAAYIDRDFRDAVYDEVYGRFDRAVAPNPGTDAVPVLRHMRLSRRLDLAQQSILAGMMLFLLCAPVVDKLGLITGLILWTLVGVPTLIAEFKSNLPTGSISAATAVRTNWARVALIVFAVLAGLFIAYYIWFMSLTDSFSDSVSSGASLELGEPSAPERGPGLGSVFGWLLVLASVTATCGAIRARNLMSIPAELEPAGTADQRAHFIGLAQHSPVVTYNAARAPFVGSGFPLATWQLAMTLRPADASAGDGSAMTADPVALNRSVKARIQQLGSDSAVTRRLPGLELSDHVYVSGRDTAAPVFHPYELARAGFPFETVEQVQADPTTPVRHYLRCTIDSWGGELVTTVYLHCAFQGETLYVEFTSCVLPPTRGRYHVFGSGVSENRAVFLGLARGIAAMPIEFVRSPVDLMRELARGGSAAPSGGAGLGIGDHGALAGIRELGTDVVEHNYFQYRDSIKYIEILERQILDALLDYLRENNVDVSELDERANTIVNNGVINYGKLNTAAAGANAKATVGSVGDKSRGSVS
ncbi:hypothetical protein [Glycomyces sp. NPDC048151]|uniref:hypothetical protein n=1 Tax=Glycomyces sp. NPDC048151 TaxID=3364002 RepID=UPI00371052E6